MNPDAEQPRQPWLWQVLLETGPWLAPVLIALTPAVGFGARWGAMNFADVFGPSLQITAAEPFAVNAATGALYMLVAVIFFATVMLADRYLPSSRGRGRRLLRAVARTILVILFLLIPAGLVLVPVLLVGALLMSWETQRLSNPSWRGLLPIALVFSVATTISFAAIGLVPGVGVAEFNFRPNSQATNGRYIELARSADSLFLYPCEDTQLGALVIRPDDVLKQTFEKKPLVSAAPSLFAMVVWHRPFRLGLPTTCPSPP